MHLAISRFNKQPLSATSPRPYYAPALIHVHFSIVEVQLTMSISGGVKRDAQCEWVVLHQRRGTSLALTSRYDGAATHEERNLVQIRRDSGGAVIAGAAVGMVGEVVVVDLRGK